MDERARHFRRLRRLRGSARRWSVAAGTFAGAAAVLTPYHGIGLTDALVAAAAGGSTMLAVWRWADARALAAQPAPPPPDPALAAARTRRRLLAAVDRMPAGRAALDELRRVRAQLRLRGTAVAEPWARLDQAARTLAGLADRLGGPAQAAVREAAVAERGLRDLAERVASVERALALAPRRTCPSCGGRTGSCVASSRTGWPRTSGWSPRPRDMWRRTAGPPASTRRPAGSPRRPTCCAAWPRAWLNCATCEFPTRPASGGARRPRLTGRHLAGWWPARAAGSGAGKFPWGWAHGG